MIWTGYVRNFPGLQPELGGFDSPPAASFRVVCATCQAVIREGTPGALVSHGQCQGCHDAMMAELDRLCPLPSVTA